MQFEAKLRACRGLLSLFLLIVVVGHLAVAAYRVGQFLTSSATSREGAYQLDSFSQSSVAAAILKQEAERLLAAYLQSGQPDIDLSRLPSEEEKTQNRNQLRTTAFKSCALDPSRIQPLEKLRRSIQQLNSDLDTKLMLVYYENGLWSEFLERYLHLLHTEPENAFVVNWAWCALMSAQSSHRTGEILNEFDHLTRFHPQFKTAHGLCSALEEWKAAQTGMVGPVYSRVDAESAAAGSGFSAAATLEEPRPTTGHIHEGLDLGQP
jgi:hypothetical protein